MSTPRIDRRLELLARLGPPMAVAEMVAEALPAASGVERSALAREAAATGTVLGLQAALPAWDRSGGLDRVRLRTAGGGAASAALETLATTGLGPATRRAAVDWLAERPDPRALGALVGLLRAPEPGIRARAARGLRQAVLLALGPRGLERVAPARRAALDGAVRAALADWRHHRCADVLVGAALLLVRAPAASDGSAPDWPWSVAAATGDPLLERGVVRWIGHPGLDPLARALLARKSRADLAERLAWDHHLFRAPRRARALRSVVPSRRLLPRSVDPATWTAAEGRAVATLVDLLPLGRRAREVWRDAVRRSTDPVTRWRCLDADRRRAAGADPTRWRAEREPALRRVVALEALRGAPRGVDTWLDDADPTLARRARIRSARVSVAALRRHWNGMGDPARSAAMRTLLEHDRAGLVAWCAEVLADDDPRVALEAVLAARRWRLVPDLEPQLIERVASGAPAVAASAVAALADGGSATRLVVLGRALDHGDARVVANAIGALERARRDTGGAVPRLTVVAGFAASDHNRVRANAIKAQRWATPEIARTGVRRMLEDDRPLHRVSALWAAGAIGGRTLGSAVRRVARHDPVPEVRRRAERVLHGLALREAVP